MWIEIAAGVSYMVAVGVGAVLGCWVAHWQWVRKFNRENYNPDGSLREPWHQPR